jgi:hypothetical protein
MTIPTCGATSGPEKREPYERPPVRTKDHLDEVGRSLNK